jgi:hypothetical protein
LLIRHGRFFRSVQIFSLGLSFDLLVSPSPLTGIQMSSTFGNTSPGSASVSKTAQLLSGGPAITSGTFLITDTPSLQAQTGSVTQSGFANSFFLTPASTATPEIGSLAMIGSGLAETKMPGPPFRRPGHFFYF